MSSRFLKKVTTLYGNDKSDLDCTIEDVQSFEDTTDGCSYSNKFNLLLNDSTESEDELQSMPSELKVTELKKSKKLKSKEKKHKNSDKFKDMTEDEIMDAVNSLDVKDVINEKESVDVLCVKIRNLNENIELQQLFGPPVESAGTQNDRLRQRTQNPLLKFTFGKRNANWPNVSFSKMGLRMELAETVKREGKWCIVMSCDEYLQAERALKAAMRTGSFQDHLRSYPYHVNTLLQMATMLVHQEDFSIAADLWKRIFYVYETITPLGLSLLGSNSVGSLSNTNFSLEYRYRLNRGIFIAMFQWILYLCQKSCFNTALEYCKLLLSINTDYDPLAIILLIDDIAIRCDQYDFLIKFYNQFKNKKTLKYLPNYAFSMSICYFFKSSHNKKDISDLSTSNDLLQEALCTFPTFLSNFIEHCNIQVDDKIKKSPFFSKSDDPASLNILIQLYSKRSLNFWKNTSVLKWVEANANSILDKLSSQMDNIKKERKHVIGMYNRETPLAIKRHLLLSGFGELAHESAENPTQLIFDPFPPINSEGGFDHYIENEAELQLDGSWLMNFLRSISPSFGV